MDVSHARQSRLSVGVQKADERDSDLSALAQPSITEANAGVLAPPPLLFLGGWVCAHVLHRLFPLPLNLSRRTRFIGGSAASLLGAGLSAAVVVSFKTAGTAVSPLASTNVLVTTGLYQRTRNPDYVGQSLIFLGAAVMSRSAWTIAMLPVLLVIIDVGVIRREERYLRRTFGSQFAAYTAHVPRWL